MPKSKPEPSRSQACKPDPLFVYRMLIFLKGGGDPMLWPQFLAYATREGFDLEAVSRQQRLIYKAAGKEFAG